MRSSMMSRHLRAGLFTAGTLLVTSGATTAQSDVPRLQLVEDLRLDANVEDFSAFSRVIVGPKGQMAVPLAQDMEIRLYDAAGRRVATAGRRGSGPGEFQHFGAVVWIGDTLFVDDQRERRVTYIGPAGEVLRTRALPQPRVPRTDGRAISDSSFLFFIAQAGSADGAVFGIAALSSGRLAGPTGAYQRVLLSLSTDGAARVIATPPPYNDARWMITIGGLENRVPFALEPQIVFSADGSRFAFMTTDQSVRDGTYAVTVFDARGDTVFARRYPFRGVPIPRSAVDSAIEAMAPKSGAPREEGSDPSRFQAVARQRIPATYAPVERIVLGLDHTTWLTLRATPQGREALVLNAVGTVVASVLLPPQSRVQQATSSHLWVTEADADGLTSVVRYRIVRPDRGRGEFRE